MVGILKTRRNLAAKIIGDCDISQYIAGDIAYSSSISGKLSYVIDTRFYWEKEEYLKKREKVMHYIKREEVIVDLKRLNKKYKGKYRYKATAKALVHYNEEDDSSGLWHYSKSFYLEGQTVYSKTELGAKTTAITSLLHRCRPPLTKKQKRENKYQSKNHKRRIYTEVRVSNSLDFIMDGGKDNTWKEIR